MWKYILGLCRPLPDLHTLDDTTINQIIFIGKNLNNFSEFILSADGGFFFFFLVLQWLVINNLCSSKGLPMWDSDYIKN